MNGNKFCEKKWKYICFISCIFIVLGFAISSFLYKKYSLRVVLQNIPSQNITSCMLQKDWCRDQIIDTIDCWVVKETEIQEILIALDKMEILFVSNVSQISFDNAMYHLRLYDSNNKEYCVIIFLPNGEIYYEGLCYKLAPEFSQDYITSILDKFLDLYLI